MHAWLAAESPAVPRLPGRAFLEQSGQKSDQQKQHVYDCKYEHLTSPSTQFIGYSNP